MMAVVEDVDRLAGEDAFVNRNSAMSGRPHGPYTVKKRKPVTGNPYRLRVGVRHQLVAFFVAAYSVSG